MFPVFDEVNDVAVGPFLRNEISQQDALDRGIIPMRNFMFRQTRENDLALFVSMAHQRRPDSTEDIATAMRETSSGIFVALPPDTIEAVLGAITAAIQQTVTAGGQPLLLCAQQVRPGVRNMTRRRIPSLLVLAYTEISPDATVTTEGVIRIDQ